MSNIKTFILISFFASLISGSVNAMTFDKVYLINFVKSYIEQNIPVPTNGKMEVSVAEIDPRIHISPCETPLLANIPENHNGRNVNVKIYCEDSTPWRLFIPVQIKTMVPILVADAAINKGSVLDTSNMVIEYRDINTIRGETIDQIESISGARSKRNLRRGAVVTHRNICVVCKGESVTIIANSATFLIKTEGTALSDGSIGEEVNVKNNRSGRTISARVKSMNQVVINL